MDTSVQVERQGPVTIVTLDRPQVRNAVDGDTALRLYDAFVAFEEDPQALVAVFHGANGHFCAGWDLQAGARLAQQGGAASVLSLTGRKVEAAEALQMGLANRVVPRGAARAAAVALGKSLPDALEAEWERSKARIPDALEGAGRFAAGEGRHGKF